jgi:hypothetical protein
MVLKAFFDGGNQADSIQYDVVSLASVCGVPDQWRGFDRDWKAALATHHAPWLHTTDALTLNKPFTKQNGWDKERVHAFISACTLVAENHLAVPLRKDGLVPHVVTIVLKDFIRAREANQEVPKDATTLCATQSVATVLARAAGMGAHFVYLTFDQNEPFMGHIYDRQHNKKARRHLKPFAGKISGLSETDMRYVPALQMADLFAWCYSHKNANPPHEWQRTLLAHRK